MRTALAIAIFALVIAVLAVVWAKQHAAISLPMVQAASPCSAPALHWQFKQRRIA
jgi:hypothetical protein